MPQATREPIRQRQQVDVASITQRGAVDANPAWVRTAVTAAPSSRTQALAAALTGVQPGLTKYLLAKQDEVNAQDAASGQAARVAVGNVDSPEALARLDKAQSASFQIGYMKMHASLEAAKKTREMVSDYQTSFNPDTDNIDDFLAKHLNPKDTQGMDKSYLDTYVPAVANAAEQLRGEYQKQVTDNVLQKRKNMIFEGATYLADNHADTMTTPSKEDVQTIYDAGAQMGMSKKDIEEQIFNAFQTASVKGNGNPRLMDYFFGNRADGSPGLAYTSQFGPHVVAAREAAEQHAYTEYTRGLQLQKLQQGQISDTLSKELSDMYYKGQNITPLVNQYKDYLTSTDYQMFRKLGAEGKFEPEDPTKVAQLEYLVSIGEAGPADVKIAYNESDINRGTLTRLLNKAEEVSTRGNFFQNSLAAKNAGQYLEGLATPGGPMAALDPSVSAKRAAALRDYHLALAKADPTEDPWDIAEKIRKRYGYELPDSAKPNAARKPIAAETLPNGSIKDWKRATISRYKAGLFDSDEDFNDEMAFLDRLDARMKATPTTTK